MILSSIQESLLPNLSYRMRLTGALLTSALLLGCATTGVKSYRDLKSANPLSLVSSTSGPKVQQLVQTFYQSDRAVPALEMAALIESALASHPHNAKVHEIAGYQARLLGDGERALHHFIKASCDLNAKHTLLYLWEIYRQDIGPGERAILEQLFAELQQHHPDPLVRHSVTVKRIGFALRQDRMAAALELSKSLNVVDTMAFIGAFDNDQGKGFLTEAPPELGIDLAATYPGRRVPIKWRSTVRLEVNGAMALGQRISPASWSVAYLVSWVHVPQKTSAWVRVTTHNPLRVWVNDGLVLSEQRVDRRGVDAMAAPIELLPGWNKLLIKSAKKNKGSWALTTRITDAKGAAVTGLRLSAEQQTTPVVGDSDQTQTRVLPAHLADLQSPARRAYLTSRYQRQAGLYKRAIKSLQSLRQSQPNNIPALLNMALLNWDIGEMGKAIDMLNRGIELSAGEALAFLLKRARFYKQKKRWDRALADLQTVTTKAPGLFAAEMALGDLYDRRGWTLDRCRQYGNVLKKWPNSAWTMRELGKCKNRLGYRQQAQQLFLQAHALEPGQVWGLKQLRDYEVLRNDYQAAWTHMEKILELHPNSTDQRIAAAKLRRKMGDVEGAQALLKAALTWDPDYATPYSVLGDIAYEQGQAKQAVAYWRQALERDPDNSRLADHLNFVEPEGYGILEEYIASEEIIEQAIADAREFKIFPGTQVAFLLDHEATNVAGDGSATAVVTTVELAVNKQGRDALIHHRVPGYGKTKILLAYSINKDGETQEASSIRQGSIRFRSLDIGSIVVIQYVHYRPPQRFLPNHFSASWFFEGIHRQFHNSKWVLILPKARTLNVEVGPGVESSVEEKAQYKVHTYTIRKRPPVIAEPFMPPAGDVLSQVRVSTVDGWDEYAKWELALLSEAFESNPQLEALAKKLVGDKTEPREKFDHLFHHVAQEIRYQQDYENTIAGVRPHPASMVLERGYGDCKDKAVLLIQLARLVGVEVHFAILRTTNAGKVRTKIPNQQFNHAIVYVPKQQGIAEGFFIDPTTDGLDMGNIRADDQGATSLVMDPKTGDYTFMQIPYQEPELDYSHYKVTVDVDPEHRAHAFIEMTLRGSRAVFVRRTLRDSESAKKLFDGLGAALFPGSKVVGFESGQSEDIWKPVSVVLQLDITAAIEAQEDGYRLNIPMNVPLSSHAALNERRYELRLGTKRSERMDIEVKLPKGERASFLPPSFQTDHACFIAKRESSQKTVGGRPVATVRYSFRSTCAELSPQDYPAFRTAVFEVVNKQRDPLKFGK